MRWPPIPRPPFLAVLHALCLSTFHRHAVASCLEITGRSGPLAAQAPGLKDSASAQSLDARQDAWIDRCPPIRAICGGRCRPCLRTSAWTFWPIAPRAPSTRWSSPGTGCPGRTDHADALARAVGLDMVAAGWRPTVETYLGRVPKARILAAVREAVSDEAADRRVSLRKGEMATEAEALLAETGWLPEPLRTPEGSGPDVPEAPGRRVWRGRRGQRGEPSPMPITGPRQRRRTAKRTPPPKTSTTPPAPPNSPHPSRGPVPVFPGPGRFSVRRVPPCPFPRSHPASPPRPRRSVAPTFPPAGARAPTGRSAMCVARPAAVSMSA